MIYPRRRVGDEALMSTNGLHRVSTSFTSVILGCCYSRKDRDGARCHEESFVTTVSGDATGAGFRVLIRAVAARLLSPILRSLVLAIAVARSFLCLHALEDIGNLLCRPDGLHNVSH